MNEENIPPLNGRIKKIIELHSNGNVRQFADFIGVSQQKLNRLFSVDSRTNKWPIVSTDILVKITEMFVNIDPDWLLVGKGGVYRSENRDKVKQLFGNNIKTKNTENTIKKNDGKNDGVFDGKPKVHETPSNAIPDDKEKAELRHIISEQAEAIKHLSGLLTGVQDEEMNELRDRRRKLDNKGTK